MPVKFDKQFINSFELISFFGKNIQYINTYIQIRIFVYTIVSRVFCNAYKSVDLQAGDGQFLFVRKKKLLEKYVLPPYHQEI